jgi:hypothetical protein
MVLGGASADVQGLADVRVRGAVGEQAQYLELARAEGRAGRIGTETLALVPGTGPGAGPERRQARRVETRRQVRGRNADRDSGVDRDLCARSGADADPAGHASPYPGGGPAAVGRPARLAVRRAGRPGARPARPGHSAVRGAWASGAAMALEADPDDGPGDRCLADQPGSGGRACAPGTGRAPPAARRRRGPSCLPCCCPSRSSAIRTSSHGGPPPESST